ncbi:MAG: MipA/OmpV family protein [Alphaproteobacteria bacterium]|nr:MAG: MipA/OmpV family protein [Alphaproteobacteria bacterium]TAF14174.1 MAG: MipA/OmpV family protein [Alphaproteobacteria bacterium]TAF39391.1 MAG: MipA/OmpV family protein [Alphaproteobacteria bacterium]TAF74950.1 MAG: MipA/OmpV family protein [Alphaproteobacteria bacterium]
MTLRILLSTLSLVALSTSSVWARNSQILDYSKEASANREQASDWSGFVAAGAIYLPEYDGSEEYQAIPALAGQVNKGNYYLALRGLQAMANVVDSSQFNAGPMLQFRFGRDGEGIDNAAIAALRPVDDAVEFGGFASWIERGLWHQGDNLELTAELLQDVANGHGGYLGEVGATYFTPVTQRLRYSVNGFLNYQSQDYMDSYFTVDADNAARSGMRTHDAQAGFNSFSIGNQLFYSFDANWGLMGLVNYTRFIADAASSPIIEDNGTPDQFLSVLAVTYRF